MIYSLILLMGIKEWLGILFLNGGGRRLSFKCLNYLVEFFYFGVFGLSLR